MLERSAIKESATLSKEGNIAWIGLDNPPVNGLSKQLRSQLLDAILNADADSDVAVIVLAGAEGTRGFCGGADIREFNTVDHASGPPTAEIIRTIETIGKPVIAAVEGFALGGGLEVGLACDYRLAHPDAKIGMPEVNIGLIPGAGGTQRLPRIVGVETALDMVQKGHPVTGENAVGIGLADGRIGEDLRASVRSFLETFKPKGPPKRRLDTGPVTSNTIDFERRRSHIRPSARNGVAQQEAIASVEDTTCMALEEGLRAERKRFEQLLASPESAALKYTFFAERESSKVPDVTDKGWSDQVQTVAIIGAGTMGGGIAMALADSGFDVVLMDMTEEQSAKGRERIVHNYEISRSRGRLTEEDVNERLGRIRTEPIYGHLEAADLVVEAVFEDMKVKKEVFRRLDEHAREGAILATNTSRLDVDEIAGVVRRPENVIGMHFFSPANVMRLLEVVRGERTATGVIETVMRLARRLNKTPVLARVSDGFIGNRMLSPFRREADFLVEEGATVAQVDQALTAFGMAMGPFAVADLAGLDISWAARKREYPHRDPDLRYPKLGDRLCEAGRFGQKTGEGYFRYEDESRTPIPDPQVERIADKIASEELGIKRSAMRDEQIVERCLLALVNEGFKLLGEGVAIRESDIDVVYVNGYGFPAYRGGPMYWARTVGLEYVVSELRQLRDVQGPHWEPAPLLVQESTAAEPTGHKNGTH